MCWPNVLAFVPQGPLLFAGTNNEVVVLELTNGTADATMQLVGEPILQKPQPAPPSMRCDPGAPGKQGSAVRMATETAKHAHQQQWDYNVTTGLLSLKAREKVVKQNGGGGCGSFSWGRLLIYTYAPWVCASTCG